MLGGLNLPEGKGLRRLAGPEPVHDVGHHGAESCTVLRTIATSRQPSTVVCEEHARRRLIVALTRLQRCISIGVVGLVAFLCARGMLPIVVVGVMGTLLALANKVNHWLGPCARFSLAVKRLLGQIPWRCSAPRVDPAVEAV